jgi:starch phosphorylase
MSKGIFNPNALTLGFARRFATYKRPDLLLYDTDRLLRILCNPERPVQLIIAGKAHPADLPGQALIQKWILFIRRPEVREHIIFLKDDDIRLTEHLVQGVDVWLNMPRRPWEACGTSGMKTLVNGGLNVSELDGWWAEAYAPELGWALGDGQEHGDDPVWDAKDADALYTLLENEVVPKFYTRDQNNIPVEWIKMMRASMSQLTSVYSTNRAVREYTEDHYIPSAKAYLKRIESNGDMATHIVMWKELLKQNWSKVRFGQLSIETQKHEYIFTVPVYLGDLDPDTVRVQLYADKSHELEHEYECIDMHSDKSLVDNGYLYSQKISTHRNASDYTIRVIPHHPQATVPLEEEHILWQK